MDIESPMHMDKLYPGPGTKIPFACQTWAFLKSPFSPDMTYSPENVLREDGYPIPGGRHREGVIVFDISNIGEIHRQFPKPANPWSMPAFAEAVSLYIDGKKQEIGHIGYKTGIEAEFNFATILTPFLWPGEHVGKIVIQLPSGETLEYEWQFEITWW
jgi:hypothetical protein